MAILLIVEHDNRDYRESLLNVLAAAQQIGGEVDLLVAGHECQALADSLAAIPGVSRVLLAQSPIHEHALAENLAPLVARLAPDYSHVLMAAGTSGKNLLPRVSAMLDVAAVADICEVVGSDTFKRPIYAGNAIATVQSREPIKVVSVRTTAFAAVDTGEAAGQARAEVQPIDPGEDAGLSVFVEESLAQSERPELTAAKVVISGGRGMAGAEHFAMLERIADKLGGAVGASRAAVDAGYVPNDVQVGQTGKIVAPKLYIAVGISGAIQHLAGMKDSQCIVAINRDAEAPIFQVADYGLVADLFEVLPELESQL